MTGRDGQVGRDVDGAVQALTPEQRVASILQSRSIRYGRPFDGEVPVVCFTQTTRRALAAMTPWRYTPAGIAFEKQAIWDARGGPALYVRGDEYDDLRASKASRMVLARAVRYWPGVTDDGTPTPSTFFRSWSETGQSEWTHEREWRIPQPEATNDLGPPTFWSFQPADVAFLVVEDAAMRTRMVELVRHWGGDADWIASIPLATFDRSTSSYAGVPTVWP